MRNDKGNSKILIIGVLSIVLGLVALGVIFKTVIFPGDKNEPSMLTEVSGAENNGTKTNTDDKEQTDKDDPAKSNSFSEGVTIDGVDVSGKSKEEVKELFASKNEAAENKDLNISFKLDEETVALAWQIPPPSSWISLPSYIPPASLNPASAVRCPMYLLKSNCSPGISTRPSSF